MWTSSTTLILRPTERLSLDLYGISDTETSNQLFQEKSTFLTQTQIQPEERSRSEQIEVL